MSAGAATPDSSVPSAASVRATLNQKSLGRAVAPCAWEEDASASAAAPPAAAEASLRASRRPSDEDHEGQPAGVGHEHGEVEPRHLHVQGGRGAQGGTAPGNDVHRAGAERHRAGSDPPVQAQPVEDREHRGHRDQEGDGSRAVEVHHHREHRGADDDARGTATRVFHDEADDRVEHAGVGQDAEEEDGEDEHRGHRADVPDALGGELRRVEPESREHGAGHRDGDQRRQGRQSPGEDEREEDHHDGHASESQHR
jgi:hypothetical protein